MNISGKEILEVLQDIGFANDGLSGNHFVAKKGAKAVLIPDEDELAEKTVLTIIDQAGLSSKDIVKLLRVKRGESAKPPQIDDEPAPSDGLFRRAWNAKGWLAPVAALRILLGLLFLLSALEKAPWVPGPFGWLKPFLESVSSSAQIPFVKSMVDSVLIPNLLNFGWFQYSVEMVFAVCLLLGFFTVIIGLVATLWAIFFSLLAVSLPDPFVMLYVSMWIGSLIVVFATRSGRSFGIDQAIARKANERKEESWFWRYVSWLV